MNSFDAADSSFVADPSYDGSLLISIITELLFYFDDYFEEENVFFFCHTRKNETQSKGSSAC